MIEYTFRHVLLVVFLVALALGLYKDRKKISRVGILFYRRTEKGLDLIDRIANKSKRFWSIYGSLAAVTGIISIFVGLGMVTYAFVDLFATEGAEGGPSMILPGLEGEASFQPGVSFVPIETWILAIAVLMVVHEASHGIVARAEDFELNSVGYIVLGVLPGAFVEPKGERMLPGGKDEDTSMDLSGGIWEQGNWKSRLKVLGAGSFANYIVGFLFLLAAAGISAGVTADSHIVYQTEEGYPAADAGMTNGTLYEVNKQSIVSPQDLQTVSDEIEVGDTVQVWSSEGNFTFQAVEREDWEGGYIGIQIGEGVDMKERFEPYQSGLEWFVSMLWIVGMLNILIGLFNLLPIKPLDGGLMIETLMQEYIPNQMRLLNHFSVAIWALIIIAVAYSIYI